VAGVALGVLVDNEAVVEFVDGVEQPKAIAAAWTRTPSAISPDSTR
jgi:hypothetical protein